MKKKCVIKTAKKVTFRTELCNFGIIYLYVLVAVGSSGILKWKQKLVVTFNSDKLGGIDFTKFSKLTMCSAQAITFLKILYVKFSPKIRIFSKNE